MTDVCSVCLDANVHIPFQCPTAGCIYQLCADCIRMAFNDASGNNSSKCLFCGVPSDLEMISSLCGPNATKSVEKKIRSEIEFEVKADVTRKELSRENAASYNSRARNIFNELTEEINLKCPRCKTAFYDYDGCNALTCRVNTCKASFCAICLQDCGSDAHEHVRSNHDSLFDRGAFHDAKLLTRTRAILKQVLAKIKNEEPFEVIQLVKNHVDKANLLEDEASSRKQGQEQHKSRKFINDAKQDLLRAVQSNRLSILADTRFYSRPGNSPAIDRDKLSPRYIIPPEYRITLVSKGVNRFIIRLNYETTKGEEWKSVALENVKEVLKDSKNIAIVSNLKQALTCSVIAIENQSYLYQTRFQFVTGINKDENQESDEISISFIKVCRGGTLLEDNYGDQCFPNGLYGDHHGMVIKLLAFNPNLRMLLLEKHVTKSAESDFLYKPLRHLLGDGKSTALLDEILQEIPETFSDLNDEQKKVAHPLKLKTAMEVAGPPGEFSSLSFPPHHLLLC